MFDLFVFKSSLFTYKNPVKFGIHGNQSLGFLDTDFYWLPTQNINSEWIRYPGKLIIKHLIKKMFFQMVDFKYVITMVRYIIIYNIMFKFAIIIKIMS